MATAVVAAGLVLLALAFEVGIVVAVEVVDVGVSDVLLLLL